MRTKKEGARAGPSGTKRASGASGASASANASASASPSGVDAAAEAELVAAATSVSDEDAIARLPGLLNDFILSKCEQSEHVRRSDFDGTAREALQRISFLQAMQAIEHFAGSVSSRIQKRPAYLMGILRGQEHHWDKSRAAANMEGGSAKLLALPPQVLTTIADLCLVGNLLPSDFTPEVCLSLHRLTAPLAVKAIVAFNSNKRIGAGNRGGVLNRPRFFQRLIQNVAEQNSFDLPAGGAGPVSASSTPTSQSSAVSSSFSSSPSLPSPRKSSNAANSDRGGSTARAGKGLSADECPAEPSAGLDEPALQAPAWGASQNKAGSASDLGSERSAGLAARNAMDVPPVWDEGPASGGAAASETLAQMSAPGSGFDADGALDEDFGSQHQPQQEPEAADDDTRGARAGSASGSIGDRALHRADHTMFIDTGLHDAVSRGDSASHDSMLHWAGPVFASGATGRGGGADAGIDFGEHLHRRTTTQATGARSGLEHQSHHALHEARQTDNQRIGSNAQAQSPARHGAAPQYRERQQQHADPQQQSNHTSLGSKGDGAYFQTALQADYNQISVPPSAAGQQDVASAQWAQGGQFGSNFVDLISAPRPSTDSPSRAVRLDVRHAERELGSWEHAPSGRPSFRHHDMQHNSSDASWSGGIGLDDLRVDVPAKQFGAFSSAADKVDSFSSADRAVADEVVRLRAALRQQQDENIRLKAKHDALLYTLRQALEAAERGAHEQPSGAALAHAFQRPTSKSGSPSAGSS